MTNRGLPGQARDWTKLGALFGLFSLIISILIGAFQIADTFGAFDAIKTKDDILETSEPGKTEQVDDDETASPTAPVGGDDPQTVAAGEAATGIPESGGNPATVTPTSVSPSPDVDAGRIEVTADVRDNPPDASEEPKRDNIYVIITKPLAAFHDRWIDQSGLSFWHAVGHISLFGLIFGIPLIALAFTVSFRAASDDTAFVSGIAASFFQLVALVWSAVGSRDDTTDIIIMVLIAIVEGVIWAFIILLFGAAGGLTLSDRSEERKRVAVQMSSPADGGTTASYPRAYPSAQPIAPSPRDPNEQLPSWIRVHRASDEQTSDEQT